MNRGSVCSKLLTLAPYRSKNVCAVEELGGLAECDRKFVAEGARAPTSDLCNDSLQLAFAVGEKENRLGVGCELVESALEIDATHQSRFEPCRIVPILSVDLVRHSCGGVRAEGWRVRGSTAQVGCGLE
jgi:hypothetical protein